MLVKNQIYHKKIKIKCKFYADCKGMDKWHFVYQIILLVDLEILRMLVLLFAPKEFFWRNILQAKLYF